MRFRIELEDDRKLTLPPEIVETLSLPEGDTVVLTLEEGCVILQSHCQLAQAIQAKYARPEFAGMVEELIAERRAEAERE